MQENNDRQYLHCNIRLRLPIIDTLKRWNKKHATVHHDNKFVKLLLVDVFGAKSLKLSSLSSLDPNKIRFIRGTFFIYEKSTETEKKYEFVFHISDIFFKRVGSDIGRACRFNSIVNNYCLSLRSHKKRNPLRKET